MASEGNSDNNTDPLLQNLIIPSINPPPPTLFSLPEHNGVDVALPTPSELKDRLIFGPYPHSVLVDALSQNPSSSSPATTSFSDHSAVKPKPTHHGVHRSRSAPPMAAINDITHPVGRVFHQPKSYAKSTVRQAALLIVYLSVMSVATVLYGDQALKTFPGWLLAAIWLLVSTLAVALVFSYLAKARVDKRNREWAKRVLNENMSLSQFFAADIDNNGYVSISEYTIYKLKQMEKISQEDIIMIAKQFEKLDRTNSGKITLSDLL